MTLMKNQENSGDLRVNWRWDERQIMGRLTQIKNVRKALEKATSHKTIFKI